MKIMSEHYQQFLKKQIESAKGEKIADGPLAILENSKYLAEKIKGENEEEKLFLSSKVKQMIFHIICPNGRIERTKEERKNVWTEVTVSVYEDKNDQFPIGSYTSICLYDSICKQVSNNEKIKDAISLAEGAALTRALTRAGIGLEFFTDFDLEVGLLNINGVEQEQEQQAKAEQKKEQEEKLANALSVPVFEPAPVEQPATVEPTPAQATVEVKAETEISQPEKDVEAEAVTPQEQPQVKEEQPQPAEKKSRGHSKTKEVETKPDTSGQMTIVEAGNVESEESLTLDEAYNVKIEDEKYQNLNGKTLREIAEEKKRLIWQYYKKAPSKLEKKLKLAIELVVADLSEKDAEYREFVKSHPVE